MSLWLTNGDENAGGRNPETKRLDSSNKSGNDELEVFSEQDSR